MNKRGFELTINTIILIVLGVFLLVGLLFLLNKEFGFFNEFLKMNQVNVDSTGELCDSYALQDAKYEYCCVSRNVITEDSEEKMTCLQFAEKFPNLIVNKLGCENAC